MNQSQANYRKRLQGALYAEIKSLEDSLQALRLRSNALSPVSSLPPEVFAAIFSLLCLPGTPPLGGEPAHHLARLHLSHVCHQRREVALDQPFLWSHVDFSTLSPVGAAEILARAKSVPLYLEANVSGYPWDDVRFSTFRKELQARMPHIRCLRASAEPIHLNRTLEGLVSPAPTLECLSLAARGEHPDNDILPLELGGGLRMTSIPRTLFDGTTPRLSWLELCNCNISWKSSLLRGLEHLEIFKSRSPKLAHWLDALNEMPQLKTLTLHSASPQAPIKLVVERTITLPSLTRLDILASTRDCSLALAHLDLPALTCLCLTSTSFYMHTGWDMRDLLSYVMRHAHGPQDTQPLQSVLISGDDRRVDILAWPVPNIDDVVHDPPTLLAATIPTRMALSLRASERGPYAEHRVEILDMVLAGLPLDGLVTLAAHNLGINRYERDLQTQQFWRHLLPKWPLLQRVRLAPNEARGFIVTLLEINGGRERLLLPLLTELVMVDFSLHDLSLLPLYDALMKCVEQGVPVKMLDLRMCTQDQDSRAEEDWLRSLTDIVANVLGPEKTPEEREQMAFMWETVGRGPFVTDGEVSEE
ncbi:hypothetical protein EI94DRAFT_1736595 [Lactarius quietus]|nr:hypothetical protein EI94DRAFT_1736595 [Lactarius quietus]